MRILLVHNYYNSDFPSGENQAFEVEKRMLIFYGHDVEVFTYHSDTIKKSSIFTLLRVSLFVAWNPAAYIKIKKVLTQFKPDVVHIHNTYPLISPSIFYAISPTIATIMTLHNYRLTCANGIPFRNNKICIECINKRSIFPSLYHKCYKNSLLYTIPSATNIALHRLLKTWKNKVNSFIVLTEFQKKMIIKSGIISSDSVYIKPNFYMGKPVATSYRDRLDYVVFVGRLSSEKGLETLIDAWCILGDNAPELRLIGDGPLKESLEKKAAGMRSIHFLGQVDPKGVKVHIAHAKLLILPSKCFEGFPMVLHEAFAFGTPVLVSDMDPLTSIVINNVNGLIFKTNSPSSLVSTFLNAWRSPSLLRRLSVGSRHSYDENYNMDVSYKKLIQIYEQSIKVAKCSK